MRSLVTSPNKEEIKTETNLLQKQSFEHKELKKDLKDEPGLDLYHNIRLNQIEEYNKNPNGILYLETIPQKYINYHQDCNEVNENFWTYKWFVWYYGIEEGTEIRYK